MSSPSSLPAPLHERLTVVRVDASVPGSAQALGGALAAAVPVDLRNGSTPPAPVDADTVVAHARALADRAHERRMAERSTASARRRDLAARRTELLERAQWCEATGATARALAHAAAESASRAAAARAVVEAAAARRDRVGEQRAAAAAAVEEARLELEGLDGATLDETGVRREIEAATRVEREAAEELAAADAEVARLETRLAEIQTQHAALVEQRARLEAELHRPGVAEREARVRAALADYDEVASRTGQDPGAAALADAIRRVDEELVELRRSTPEPPTDADLEHAELDVTLARRRLDATRASAAAFDGPPPAWWVELTALHAEVVDAETAVQTGGLRKSSARRRYEDALTAERARLDELGFGSYLDALMSGGRLPVDRAADEAAIHEAATWLASAERRLDRLRSDLLTGAPVVERLAERERLLAVAVGLLGTDPGDRVLELLEDHPAVPPMFIGDLADMLHAAGVATAGIGVPAAARAWLAARDEANDPARRMLLDHQLHELDNERHAIDQALAPARAVAERADEAAAAARRTVSALEAELHARAGDDGRLLERGAAARALRDRVEALESRLANAEVEALDAWTTAAAELSEVEAEQRRTERELADLRRRANRAAADLPPEHRPAFDLLTGLVALGGALRAEAASLAAELAAADTAVAAAEAAAAGDPGMPTLDDLEHGLAAALEGAPRPAVLVEPFAGLAPRTVEPLLDALLRASAEHPLVVVTSDLTVVGWAIGLPGDTCSLLPARSVEVLLDPAPHHAAD